MRQEADLSTFGTGGDSEPRHVCDRRMRVFQGSFVCLIGIVLVVVSPALQSRVGTLDIIAGTIGAEAVVAGALWRIRRTGVWLNGTCVTVIRFWSTSVVSLALCQQVNWEEIYPYREFVVIETSDGERIRTPIFRTWAGVAFPSSSANDAMSELERLLVHR